MSYPTHSARRALLKRLFDAAVAASRGDRVIPAVSRLDGNRWIYAGPGEPFELMLPTRTGRVIVIGAGKAAASMAAAMEGVLGDRLDAGLVIVKEGGALPLQRIECREGGHPVPDAASIRATRELLDLVDAARPEDTVFLLLSGGASSLLCLPVDGITLDDKAAAHRLLVNSGASIAEINAVRKHLSAVKGGRLRLRCRAATFCTLAISDVIGDDPSTIGSGPSVADTTTFDDALAVLDRYGLVRAMPRPVLTRLRRGADETPKPGDTALGAPSYRVIAGNHLALEAAATFAGAQGCDARILTTTLQGSTHDAARGFARTLRQIAAGRAQSDPPLVVLAGGETTLAVTGRGKGGRNQEFALVAGLNLQGTNNITLLAAGSDGTDGPTDAAGAFADGETVQRARSIDRDPQASLDDNDAYPLCDAMGDLYRSGPTGTNVMDVLAAVIDGTGST